MIEEIKIPEIPNYREEEGILSALEEDLGIELAESKTINPEDNEDLRNACSFMAGQIIEVFGKQQGILSLERQEWLQELAESATFLTERDFERIQLFSRSLTEDDPLKKRVLTLRVKTGTFKLSDKTGKAMNWDPLWGEDDAGESKFIFVKQEKIPSKTSRRTKQELLKDAATEELLHAIDRTKGILGRIDEKQTPVLCEAAAKTYALEVLPPWLKEVQEGSEKAYIGLWRKLEEEFGADALKRAFFSGEQSLDFVKLIERSKEIWKDGSQ